MASPYRTGFLSVLFALVLLGCVISIGVYRAQQPARQRQVVLKDAEAQIGRELQAAAPRPPVFDRRIPDMYARSGGLDIPEIGVSVAVVEGADARGLKLGAAHIIGTGYPGDGANVGIAAHRDTYFRALSRIHAGEDILLATPAGVFRYEVGSTEIVTPSETHVLQSSGRANGLRGLQL